MFMKDAAGCEKFNVKILFYNLNLRFKKKHSYTYILISNCKNYELRIFKKYKMVRYHPIPIPIS